MFMSVLIASTIDGDGVLTDGAASTLTYSVGGHAITCGTACTLTNDDACGDATTDSAAATLTNDGGTAVATTDSASSTVESPTSKVHVDSANRTPVLPDYKLQLRIAKRRLES